jgi:ABC-type transport system involved in multi-copper enzyme maturation permease subunit
MNPIISRLLGVIAAFAAAFGVMWLVAGFATWVNGRPVAIQDVSWLLIAIVPFTIVSVIIYWTNWRHP